MIARCPSPITSRHLGGKGLLLTPGGAQQGPWWRESRGLEFSFVGVECGGLEFRGLTFSGEFKM